MASVPDMPGAKARGAFTLPELTWLSFECGLSNGRDREDARTLGCKGGWDGQSHLPLEGEWAQAF